VEASAEIVVVVAAAGALQGVIAIGDTPKRKAKPAI
jgi:cation transport ATPase